MEKKTRWHKHFTSNCLESERQCGKAPSAGFVWETLICVSDSLLQSNVSVYWLSNTLFWIPTPSPLLCGENDWQTEPLELCISKSGCHWPRLKAFFCDMCRTYRQGEAFPSSDQSVLQTALSLICKVIAALLPVTVYFCAPTALV